MSEYRLPDGTTPVLLSADTVDGLRTEAAALRAYLVDHPTVTPDRVADMIFRTRVARRRRALAMVDSRDELLDALASVVADSEHPSVVSTVGAASARRVGFVFPGQGSQRPGMGKLYYDISPTFRTAVDECAAIFQDRYGHTQPLHYLLGDEGEFDDTVQVVQPALLFQMTALAAMWQAAGVRPAATIGHSQGELSACSVSGVMTLRDSILVVTHRSLLVDQMSPDGYSMAVLGMDRDECEDLLARHSGWAELSVINSPHILAISGDRATIVDTVTTANARGRFAREIRVAYPAHTSMVVEIGRSVGNFMGDELSSTYFAASDIPCYGATLGTPITPDLEHAEYWYWNLRNRVRFDRAIVAAANDGVDTFVEVAEHPMLQLAIQENLTLVPDPTSAPRDFRVIGTSSRTASGLGEFTRNLATVAVQDQNYRWSALRVESSSGAVRLPLRDFPNTVMAPQKLWAPYQSAQATPVPHHEEPTAGEGVSPTRLLESWVRLGRRSLMSPRRLLLVDPTGARAGLVAAIRAAAEEHGAESAVFDAERPPAAQDYDSVVVLLPALADLDGPDAVSRVADFYTARWLPVIDPAVTDCWLLTADGESVLPDDPAPNLFHGAVSAGFRCLAAEHIGTAFRHLDLAARDDAVAQAAAIVRALHAKGEPQLAMRGNGLYAKRFEVDAARPDSAPTSAELNHVVIIGGTGTLGLKFAEYFAEHGAQRITLLSRSGATGAVAARVREIRAIRGTEIVVLACDVSDESAARRFAAESADSPITTLVHAAVNYVHADLAEVTADKVRETASSKIIGTTNALRSWPLAADCRIIICSSAAATFGGRGQILYATVNRMLDVLAMRLRADGVNAVSMQWGIWDLPGPLHAVGLDRVTAAGVVSMDPADALTVGLTEHAAIGRPGNRLVIAADWSRMHAVLSAVGFEPVLTEVLAREKAKSPSIVPESGTSHSGDVVDAAPTGLAAGSLFDQVRCQLGEVMGATGADAIDSAVPLVALGLDSLQALDFRKRIKSELDRDLPVAAILGGASLNDVVLLMAANSH
ncbi:nocobactin polyketide synthase NbtC [Nocardia sp. NBC_01499]|uniref:nocobactin polyketide synthase NbtC n=1 Tax=Nocardia sp. NBC_01499 TaxID=2903597 RepID=UPI003869959E